MTAYLLVNRYVYQKDQRQNAQVHVSDNKNQQTTQFKHGIFNITRITLLKLQYRRFNRTIALQKPFLIRFSNMKFT